jgi:hypothetical protein
MQTPDELIIFGRVYDILDLGPLHVSEGVMGLAAYRDGAIHLDKGLDLPLRLSTLWHEAVHIAQQEILGITDEAQARWVALFIHNLLLSNPSLLECYLYGLKLMPFGFEDDEPEPQ